MNVDAFYQAGMAFANQLRLIGKHESAHEIEVYTLEIKQELENETKTES
jgi:hypothetical protein